MAKKRKRKTYNTPKKIKHKHFSAKLNIIKVINENPKCLKCNNYMANHHNRFSCNYCNKSITKN